MYIFIYHEKSINIKNINMTPYNSNFNTKNYKVENQVKKYCTHLKIRVSFKNMYKHYIQNIYFHI